MRRRACVIGAGPNGLAAAIVLAQAGVDVDVFEAEPQPGGGARTLELTLPGFRHDFGSAVHPLAVGSPFFSSLPLDQYGLEWVHSPAALAHPFDDGTAITLVQDLNVTAASMGADQRVWQKLFAPFAERWRDLANAVLAPMWSVPRHPWLLAKFGVKALLPAATLARGFKSDRTKAVFGGLAAHSLLSLNKLASSAAAVMLGTALHSVGWPIPRGGAGSITRALSSYLARLGGSVKTARRIESLNELSGYDVFLCDVTPRQLLKIGGERLSNSYRCRLEKYSYGPGVFKVDFALQEPIPWKAKECALAATVHIGGPFEEISASEESMSSGRQAERPFVLLAQPTLFDPTRAPQGKHIAWAYCHVPNGSTVDTLSKLENQIERFAPGFRDCILARRVFSPATLERMDANLVGGDIAGGATNLKQVLFRPTWRGYATSTRSIYLCSSSTPPGAAVHGMCGYHAAKLALSHMGV